MAKKDNKNSKSKKESAKGKIAHPLPPRSFLYLFYGLVFPGLGHFLLDKKKRAYAFAVCILIFFSMGLLMEGHLYIFTKDTTWLTALAVLASMAAGVQYFIALIFGWGAGNPASILEAYGNYFLLAAGLLNILIALDAMDISAGRKE
jgi:hypothetical protein